MKEDSIISELSNKECLISLLSILHTPILKRKLGDEVNELVNRLYETVVGGHNIDVSTVDDFFGIGTLPDNTKDDGAPDGSPKKYTLNECLDKYFERIWLLANCCYNLFSRFPQRMFPDVVQFIKDNWNEEWHKYSKDGNFYIEHPVTKEPINDLQFNYEEKIKPYCTGSNAPIKYQTKKITKSDDKIYIGDLCGNNFKEI